MDLKGYGVRELVELRQRLESERDPNQAHDPERAARLAQIDDELRDRHARNPEHTENELRTAAQKWGLALTEVLLGVESEDDMRARRVRYRHPYDPHLAWSGMGPKPHWVREWEATGQSLESLRIRR